MARSTEPILARHLAWEIEKVRLDRSMPRNAVRKLLTDHAEYGGWELSRLRRYRDGTRDVWLRRKVLRVVPTL
ncbi:MAG: DUF5703 family protein [Propionibacteriales bacterium]|nr:DUF5703 family protein [Propionibacteriales bacterium]